ncbi:MAG: AbrB/MazE/SpoVT family DNA-binding domain-containing protein [Candidatus Aenigmarchaeota archaeon]|nr:AbrB/MazE/SpoVT family DNA-binding domain-containing protein [Candidatus Aenigmarchaeota archaeon]
MEKGIRFKFKGRSKIQQIGNSLGVVIPKNALELLGAEKGDDILIYVSEDNQAITLFRPKSLSPKGENWERMSFELSIPKELAEKLLGK